MNDIKLCLIVFLALMTACGGGQNEENKAVRPVRFGKVIKSGDTQIQTFSGTSQASKETQLSFRVAGTITSLAAKVGQEIRTGQILAQLDPVDYNVQYEQAQAQLKNAQTQIKQAQTQLVSSKSNFERIEKLYENNSLPLSDFDQAKTNYEASKSQYEAAQAQFTASRKQVESASNQLNYTRIPAPFSGIITQVFVEENELVNAGSPIVSLSTEGQPEVQVGIPEVFISRIQQGQNVSIEFSSLSPQTFSGVVSEVGFSADGASTYPVTVLIQEPSEEIRPGMAANVRFSFSSSTKSKSDFLVVPVEAIGEDADGHFIFLLNKKGESYLAKKTRVEVGELLSNGFEIKKGAEEGNLVATAGLKMLLDGMEVKLLEK